MLNISLRQRRQRQNWQENLHLHQFKRDKMMETSVSTSILLPSLVPVVNKTGSANISSPALFIFPKKICCLNVLLIQVFSEVQSHWTFPLSYIYICCASGTILWLCQFMFDACFHQVLLIDYDMLIVMQTYILEHLVCGFFSHLSQISWVYSITWCKLFQVGVTLGF